MKERATLKHFINIKIKHMKEILLKIMERPLWYKGIKTKKGKQINRQHAHTIKMKVQKDMFSEGTLLKYLRMLGEDVQINIVNYAKKTGKNQ